MARIQNSVEFTIEKTCWSNFLSSLEENFSYFEENSISNDVIGPNNSKISKCPFGILLATCKIKGDDAKKSHRNKSIHRNKNSTIIKKQTPIEVITLAIQSLPYDFFASDSKSKVYHSTHKDAHNCSNIEVFEKKKCLGYFNTAVFFSKFKSKCINNYSCAKNEIIFRKIMDFAESVKQHLIGGVSIVGIWGLVDNITTANNNEKNLFNVFGDACQFLKCFILQITQDKYLRNFLLLSIEDAEKIVCQTFSFDLDHRIVIARIPTWKIHYIEKEKFSNSFEFKLNLSLFVFLTAMESNVVHSDFVKKLANSIIDYTMAIKDNLLCQLRIIDNGRSEKINSENTANPLNHHSRIFILPDAESDRAYRCYFGENLREFRETYRMDVILRNLNSFKSPNSDLAVVIMNSKGDFTFQIISLNNLFLQDRSTAGDFRNEHDLIQVSFEKSAKALICGEHVTVLQSLDILKRDLIQQLFSDFSRIFDFYTSNIQTDCVRNVHHPYKLDLISKREYYILEGISSHVKFFNDKYGKIDLEEPHQLSLYQLLAIGKDMGIRNPLIESNLVSTQLSFVNESLNHKLISNEKSTSSHLIKDPSTDPFRTYWDHLLQKCPHDALERDRGLQKLFLSISILVSLGILYLYLNHYNLESLRIVRYFSYLLSWNEL